MLRAMRPRHFLALALLLPILGGCWTHTAARPGAFRADPLPADAWPARDPAPMRPILQATPDKIFAYKLIDGVDPASLSDDDRQHLETPEYTITYKGIHANGLVRIYDQAPDYGPTIHIVTHKGEHKEMSFSQAMDGLILGFIPNARMMSSRTLDAMARRAELQAKLTPPPPKAQPPTATASAPTPAPTANLSVVRPESARKLEFTTSDRDLHIESGLPLRIPPPDPSKEPRGLILHLHAIAGNQYEPQVVAELVRRGWVSIDIKTETSLDSPVPESTHEEIRRLGTEVQQLTLDIYARGEPTRETWRETERRAKANPLYPRLQEAQKQLDKLRAGGFQAKNEADLPEVARQIAAQTDDALAGAAYATQAVLEYVKQERPDLRNIPVVLMGFSAGALAAPTAAARIHDQLDAVVLIGGGCDLFRISQGSVFTNGGVIILNGEEKAPKSTIDKIDKLYLEASKLDPYHTAPLIADLPILQLHASSDTWVPYETGEVLYERLNHPERLTITGGHEYLFYFLPNRKAWIADWVERTVAAHRGGRADATASAK
jgi:dienelactone hydrolase